MWTHSSFPAAEACASPNGQPRLTAWLQKNAGSIRRIASICTGIYGLAPSGLLNGRKVATHWRFAADLAKRYPALKVNSGSLYVRDGKFWTAAGVTAGIDLSLALIEDDFGSEVALSVARELVVYMKRSGGQEQYSEPLQVSSAIAWSLCGSFAVDAGTPGAGSFGRGTCSASFVVPTAVFAALYPRVWE